MVFFQVQALLSFFHFSSTTCTPHCVLIPGLETPDYASINFKRVDAAMFVPLGSKAGATPFTRTLQIHPSKQVHLGVLRNLTKGKQYRITFIKYKTQFTPLTKPPRFSLFISAKPFISQERSLHTQLCILSYMLRMSPALMKPSEHCRQEGYWLNPWDKDI